MSYRCKIKRVGGIRVKGHSLKIEPELSETCKYQKVTVLDTHNPEGIMFDLSGEALVFIHPPLDTAFTGVVRKDCLTWPHLSAASDQT